MEKKRETKTSLYAQIAYLTQILNTAFDRVDELNRHIYQLKLQILAMGGTPLPPDDSNG